MNWGHGAAGDSFCPPTAPKPDRRGALRWSHAKCSPHRSRDACSGTRWSARLGPGLCSSQSPCCCRPGALRGISPGTAGRHRAALSNLSRFCTLLGVGLTPLTPAGVWRGQGCDLPRPHGPAVSEPSTDPAHAAAPHPLIGERTRPCASGQPVCVPASGPGRSDCRGNPRGVCGSSFFPRGDKLSLRKI